MVGIFQLSKLPHIEFGSGKVNTLPKHILTFGKSIVLLTGKFSFDNSEWGKSILELLNKNNIRFSRFIINGEPSPKMIDNITENFKTEIPHCVVAIGGGSVLDAGKAVSAMIPLQENIIHYLEGVGTKTPDGTKIPFIAIPTTSGTGSECTKNAVISEIGENGFKKSLRHDNYIPNVAIIDPDLTLNLSPAQTAASGLDALTQLLESYFSTHANSFTDSIAFDAIIEVIKALPVAYNDPENIEVRTQLAYGSMISGYTLANAGLGTVHGFASPIGGYFNIPHGVVCGTLMGEILKTNIEQAIGKPEHKWFIDKLIKLSKACSNESRKDDDFYINYIPNLANKFIQEMNIPRLGQYGITQKDFDKIIKGTGNKNNPINLDNSTLQKILSARL